MTSKTRLSFSESCKWQDRRQAKRHTADHCTAAPCRVRCKQAALALVGLLAAVEARPLAGATGGNAGHWARRLRVHGSLRERPLRQHAKRQSAPVGDRIRTALHPDTSAAGQSLQGPGIGSCLGSLDPLLLGEWQQTCPALDQLDQHLTTAPAG